MDSAAYHVVVDVGEVEVVVGGVVVQVTAMETIRTVGITTPATIPAWIR